MIIKDGSVEEIHEWFLTQPTKEKVICIFLCKTPDNVKVLSDAIERSFQLDQLLGEKIGFLLSGKGLNSATSLSADFGNVYLFSGKYYNKNEAPFLARQFLNNIELSNLKIIRNTIIRKPVKLLREVQQILFRILCVYMIFTMRKFRA